MPFPTIVWKESGLLYKNNENILSIFLELTWTGATPSFFVTNKYGSDDDDKWELVTLGDVAEEIEHTFTTTGQEFGWRVVFVRGQTTITDILLTAGDGMTATGFITKEGRKIVAERAFSASPTRTIPSLLCMGEGSTAAADSDTDLVLARPIANEDTVDSMDATTGWTASGTNSVSLQSTTFLRGTGALNLVKTDTSSATASMSKTVTSRNYTSQTLLGFIRVSTALLANLSQVVVRYGSDASNYYEFVIADTAFTANEFYKFYKTAAQATSTTGSPSITAMDYLYVAMVCDGAGNTAAAGDFIVDEFFVYGSDDLTKSMESGYPAVDLDTVSVELRGRINTLQGNGFDFSEAGFKNSDSSKKLFGRYTFDEFTKADTDEYIVSHPLDVITG